MSILIKAIDRFEAALNDDSRPDELAEAEAALRSALVDGNEVFGFSPDALRLPRCLQGVLRGRNIYVPGFDANGKPIVNVVRQVAQTTWI